MTDPLGDPKQQPQSDHPDRRPVWALVFGGLGLVIGIVALVVALGAKDDASDVKVTDQAKADARAAVEDVRGQLDADVAKAKESLADLQGSVDDANKANAELKKTVEANASAVQSNAEEIDKLNDRVTTLSDTVKDQQAEIERLSDELDDLKQAVDAAAESP